MTTGGRAGYEGSGPGAIAPDGCAVDLYTRLPVGAEPEIIAAATPPPASLLELGCGAGRITRSLTKLGYAVTAVDESAEMLAKVEGARTVLSRIEDLTLPGKFDVVLLASYLVHSPAADEMLRICRRYVDFDGHVLIQREGAGWHTEVPRERPVAGGVARVVADTEDDDGFHTVHVEYEFPDAHWTQKFRSRPLTVAQFDGLLKKAGLFVERYLTPDGTWVSAAPIV
jgi:SAM-dependent methyltransferase